MRRSFLILCLCVFGIGAPGARGAGDHARRWDVVKLRWGRLDVRTADRAPDTIVLWPARGVIREAETSIVRIQEVQDLLAELHEVTFCGGPKASFEVDLPPDSIDEGDRLRMAVTARLQGVDRTLGARHPDFFIHVGATVYGGLWFDMSATQPLFVHSANSKDRHAYDRGNTGVPVTEHDLVQLTWFRTGYEGDVAFLSYADVPATEGRGTSESPQYFTWKYNFYPFATGQGPKTTAKARTLKDQDVVFRYFFNVQGDEPPHDVIGQGPTRHIQYAFLELYYREAPKGHRIHGTVTDAWGHALRELEVYLVDQTGRHLGHTTQTDAEGRYAFDDLDRELDDAFDPERDEVAVMAVLAVRRPPDRLARFYYKDVARRGRPGPAPFQGAS